jgi:predicted DNA repair protein MutK
MSSGLLALLDDVAAIVKTTAASIDDIAAGAVKASSQAAGVVIDDTAVTPKYVVGLSPARELPIVWKIAKGSLRNKLLILMPAMLLLGSLAPWAINPLLALGGLFLCYEGYEKLHHAVHSYLHPADKSAEQQAQPMTAQELEDLRTAGAIRTDFILSAEIMAIAYGVLRADDWVTRVVALFVVAIAITAGVYGTVALILKADDLGMRLAGERNPPALRRLGRAMIAGMPVLLSVLSAVGTAAMLWVGGGIIIHSVPALHHPMQHFLEGLALSGTLNWLLEATIALLFAIVLGAIVVVLIQAIRKLIPTKNSPGSTSR